MEPLLAIHDDRASRRECFEQRRSVLVDVRRAARVLALEHREPQDPTARQLLRRGLASSARDVHDGERRRPALSAAKRSREDGDRQLHQRLHLRLHSFAAAAARIIAAFQSPRHAAATVYQSKGAIATAILGWR